MQAVLQTEPNQPYKHALEWCLVASVLLHLAIVLGIAKPEFAPDKVKPEEIRIELAPKPEPPKPELPPPAPPKPPVPTPKPQPVKPLPQKVEPLPQPVKPQPEVVNPPPTPRVAEPTPPAVIAAKPTVTETKPEVVVPPPPPPEPPKATGPSESDIDAARNAFRAAAHRELKKNQRYPRIAADRGIEGEVKLNIHLDESGNVTGVDVVESSGNGALDEAAMSAAKKSSLKSYFHEILRGRVDNIIVTVSFKLAN